jgi:AbrB family looped-hinge helix DNA binding protein
LREDGISARNDFVRTEALMWKNLVISPKGQITLTKDIREALGLRTGDTIVVTIRDGALVLSPKNINFNDLAGFLGKPPAGPATLEQIDETIAGEMGRAAVGSSASVKGKAA